MNREIEKLRLAVFVILFVFLFSGCSETGGTLKPNGQIAVDYGDAEAFEAALCEGENLEGKTVMFTVLEFQPDSKLGYDVKAGEHLNFVSDRHPNIKAGDTVAVRVVEIKNQSGLWVIKYEKIRDAIIGEWTIKSNGGQPYDYTHTDTDLSKAEPKETQIPVATVTPRPTAKPTPSPTHKPQKPTTEWVDTGGIIYRGYNNTILVSSYAVFKNTSDYEIIVEDLRVDYVDNDEKLLSVDQYAECIPNAIKPGQIGYIFSTEHDITDVDRSNGIRMDPDGSIEKANNYYEIDISEVSFKIDSFWGIRIIGRGTNNTGKDRSLVTIQAVFFDKENTVLGFCYGFESFEAGRTKSFEIYGDLMSDNYDPALVDHVEVYAQGDSWY